MYPKDADRMANYADPDHTAPDFGPHCLTCLTENLGPLCSPGKYKNIFYSTFDFYYNKKRKKNNKTMKISVKGST